MIKIAIVYFPGMNCEEETKRSCEIVGMQADIIRWNSSPEVLEQYDGYIFPGGWSYEDRIRAGCISARDPLMLKIKEESKKGKVVLGICNGAQILVESGLIPGLQDKVQMALAPNINPKVSGYYCTWVNLINSTNRKNAFTQTIEENEIIKIPVAHGEGRFVTKDKHLIRDLIENGQIVFRYCDEKGNTLHSFPINPNGATYNIAAITNKEGNIMAIMPHPERATWMKQVPEHEGNFGDLEEAGPGRAIFESIKMYLEGMKW